MLYPKKLIATSALFAGLFFIGCSKGSDSDPESETNDIDLAKVMAYPYSALTPDEQKVKLENESISFLDFGNAAKTSSAVEALQHLGKLLDESPAEIIEEKDVNEVKETVQYADAYGIFTWDKVKREWTKTPSTTELKFVFPARIGATTNNAVFSVKAVSSGIAVTETYEEYDWEKDEYIDHETTYYLPKSTTGILNIDSREAASVEFSAEYKDNKEAPVRSLYKVTTNDGYVYTNDVDKATENRVAMRLTHNNKLMFEAVAKADGKIDELTELVKDDGEIEDDNYNLLGKANAYMKLMDNLVIVYTVDMENYARESEAIDKDYDAKMDALYANWTAYEKNKNRYTLLGQYEKERNDKLAEASKKYMSAALVSTKDGSKIADVIEKSEKDGEHWDYYFWDDTKQAWSYNYNAASTKKYDYYTSNYYLKFKDNTLVEMSAYFSDGFDKIEERWENFLNAFDR